MLFYFKAFYSNLIKLLVRTNYFNYIYIYFTLLWLPCIYILFILLSNNINNIFLYLYYILSQFINITINNILYIFIYNLFSLNSFMPYLFYLDFINDYILYFLNNIYNTPLFMLGGFFFCFTSFFSLIFLSYLGINGIFIVNILSLFFFWLSLFIYIDYIFFNNNFYFISLGKWMYLTHNYKITFDFFVDNTSLSFSFLTVSIAFFVYIYAYSYFRYEPLVERLVLFLNFFVISMVFLVSSGNLIMLFLGWELIGLTSFVLINFWSTRVGTLKAAFKAYSFNKISDLFLFFAIILIFNIFYTLDIPTIILSLHLYSSYYINLIFFDINVLEFISFFFLICAFIKSAQIGFHLWLPDSMEAPVPASALIHSATLVSAGIFLFLRFNTLFEYSPNILYIIGLFGSITSFYGGVSSMYQSDIKKILAYSTISHCGFLMVLVSFGVYEYVILYLYIHGFFKAVTFLSVGNIIRFTRNIQDFKRMGLFFKYLPFECLAIIVSLINLGGLPLSLGFYIKHLLFISMDLNNIYYYIIFINCTLGAITGLFYSFKLIYYIFFDIKKSKKTIYLQSQKKNLNSIYYSNSSIGGKISIFCLTIYSYIISFYLLYNYLSINYIFSDLNSLDQKLLYLNFFSLNIGYLINLSFLNWLIIFFFLSLILIFWRVSFSNKNLFKYFINSFIFIIFSYIFLII